MYVSTFGTADSTGRAEQLEAEDEDGDQAADELDPSGIFEVRETGFFLLQTSCLSREPGVRLR